MHSAILESHKGSDIDHIDGNGLNNQENNLRYSTHSQNMSNRGLDKNNKSGFKGVSWYQPSQKWQVKIAVQGKQKHLGYYSDIEEAARAYDAAAKELHGEFAWLNFPDE